MPRIFITNVSNVFLAPTATATITNKNSIFWNISVRLLSHLYFVHNFTKDLQKSHCVLITLYTYFDGFMIAEKYVFVVQPITSWICWNYWTKSSSSIIKDYSIESALDPSKDSLSLSKFKKFKVSWKKIKEKQLFCNFYPGFEPRITDIVSNQTIPYTTRTQLFHGNSERRNSTIQNLDTIQVQIP